MSHNTLSRQPNLNAYVPLGEEPTGLWDLEEEQQVLTAEDALFSTEMQDVYERYEDKEAFNGCIEAGLFLLSQTDHPGVAAPRVAQLLQTVDFNDKEVFREHEDMNTQNAKQQILTDLAIAYWQEELGMDFNADIDSAVAIGAKIVDTLHKTQFHGTNSVALEAIKGEGLRRGEKGHEEDIENILSSIKRIGESDQVFGWYKINSEKKIFYTGSPQIALDYAERSPEWFSQFTYKGNREQSYKERDYQEASRYLEERIAKWSTWQGRPDDPYGIRKNMRADEAEAIRTFFKKYWGIYGKAHPVVIQMGLDIRERNAVRDIAWHIARRRDDNENEHFEDEEEAMAYIRQKGSSEEVKTAVQFNMFVDFGMNDARIEDEDVLPGDFRYFNIPLQNR